MEAAYWGGAASIYFNIKRIKDHLKAAKKTFLVLFCILFFCTIPSYVILIRSYVDRFALLAYFGLGRYTRFFTHAVKASYLVEQKGKD
jgi:hypothetical protein